MALNYEQELEIQGLEWSLSPAASGDPSRKPEMGQGLSNHTTGWRLTGARIRVSRALAAPGLGGG